MEADEQWGNTIWFPRAKAAGWKKWAIVKPASAIGALNVSRLSQKFISAGVDTRILSDFDEALGWLKSR
jgi:hypothetical protein